MYYGDKDIREVIDFLFLEMASAGYAQEKIKGKKYLVGVDSDPKRIGNQYFKFYDSMSQDSSERVARISFLNPEYVYHGGYPRAFNLGRREKKALMKFLTSPSKKKQFKGFSGWQVLIYLYNEEATNAEYDWATYTTDFIKNHPEIRKKKWFKTALPFDLKMPDYTSLPE